MDLNRYIEVSGGPAKVAESLGVKERRVRSWMHGERQPRIQLAQKLVKASNGLLTLESIYASATDRVTPRTTRPQDAGGSTAGKPSGDGPYGTTAFRFRA